MPKIRIKRGTTSQWNSSIVPLLSGELGYDLTTKVIKIGDGTTLWNSLSNYSVAGPPGADGDSIIWSSLWDGGTTYPLNYVVFYNGSSYIKKTMESIGSFPLPTNTNFWDVLAEKGANGNAGAEGPQGDPGPAGQYPNYLGDYNNGVGYPIGGIVSINF